MTGVLIGRTTDEVRAREAALLEAFGEDATAATTGSRSAASAGSSGRRTRRGRWSGGSPTPGVERIMLQDFLPWDLDMVDLMGEALVGQV